MWRKWTKNWFEFSRMQERILNAMKTKEYPGSWGGGKDENSTNLAKLPNQTFYFFKKEKNTISKVSLLKKYYH